ncbi:DNA-directed RNA polymerase subunit alpha C-terminal domain-containing protein [Pectobacterium punjabense]|uniref:DNA-directed RNA polymerase subunit alpha C-terminal domain-containing protein n=1 Tax=Pectobacterium punjabense TaxID=2108399 RepID=UPI0032EF1C98
MRPIRAFLFVKDENGQWICQVFRDFEPLLEAAITANGGAKHPVGIHIGFERPDTQSVGELLSEQEGLVFLSSGAIGTMPFPVRASHMSIGTAGENSFHTALDGFGYQVNDPPPASMQPWPKKPILENTKPGDWVAPLFKLDPDLAKKLYVAEIWDEESYLLHEADLDIDSRYLAGLRRYEILVGDQPNPATLVEFLSSAPPWVLSAPIILLNLSIRSCNVCTEHEIKTIGDFVKYGLSGLYKLPKLGHKSVNEISREIANLFTTGLPLKTIAHKPGWTMPRLQRDIPSDSNEGFKDSDANDGKKCEFGACISANVTDGFIKVAQKLTPKEQITWFGRIGFRCEPMTLQQIADQIGLTRERVRQIEVKVYKKVYGHPFWDELSQRVQKHLCGRITPLFLNGVSAIDPWFEDVEQLTHFMRELSDNIPHLGFHILTWNDSPVISRMSQTQWLEALEQAQSTLLDISAHNLSEIEVLSQISSILIGKGEDMREALQEEVSGFCIWSALPDGTRILTGFGKSATALVSSVLQASETPLHIDEIQKRIREHSTYEATNEPNIRRAASEVGMLFGRGTYGLMKHCPLNPAQMLTIRSEVEDIISGGAPSKQWHSSEIYGELIKLGLSYEGKLTKYIINIALANSPTLVYLRRMIWGVRGKWSANASARLDVKQAIISLLEEEGKPMSTGQIRSRLIEGRGLNTYFQIWASSPLVRLGSGLWGLEGRDLDIQQARMMAYRLLKALSVRQEGMHVSEAAAFLGLSSEGDISMLASVASKDGLRMDKGQYCYLHSWGESRRISAGEAATSTLKAHPEGLPRSELQLYVDRLVKRKVDRQQFSGILQNIDAVYDAESSLWKFAGLAGEENEGEEDGTASLAL